MNCKVCPFCNKNYTELLNKDNRKTLRYDFDHFYSKSKYPFLAVSIYNLLPICSGCNKIKNNIEFSIYNNMYPYIEGIENQITFGYELLEIGEYKIVNLSKNKKFNNNEKILQIVQKYNINLESAEIEKIFSKYNQYSSDAYNEYLRKTFDDIDEYERIEIIKKELGYTKIKDIKNKSFSKLRNDIIDSLFK